MPYLEKLKMIKEEKGMTYAEIAKLSDIPLATITRIFNGNTTNPTFETFSHIAIALGASLDEIVGIKQPDAPPIPTPIENTLTSYSELLKVQNDRIKGLEEDKAIERNGRRKMTASFVLLMTFVLVVIILDILNGHLGYFRY